MRGDGALIVLAVITVVGMLSFVYLVVVAPEGKPDNATVTLFLSIFAPTVAGLLAAWRANQAVSVATQNREQLTQHTAEVGDKLLDLERKTNGGLTARLNEQTRILLDPKYRAQTGGQIHEPPADVHHDLQASALQAIADIDAERAIESKEGKPP